MTIDEGYQALTDIVHAAVVDEAIKNRLLRELHETSLIRGRMPPAKWLLGEVQIHGQKQISEETGKLIREVYSSFA